MTSQPKITGDCICAHQDPKIEKQLNASFWIAKNNNLQQYFIPLANDSNQVNLKE